MARIGLISAFLLLLAFAHAQLWPPANSATLDVTTLPRTPARIYLFRNNRPFRLTPVDGVLAIQSDLYYRDRLSLAKPSPSVLEVVAENQYHYFLLTGTARFFLPPGKYRMEAYRGLFYTPASAEFELTAGTNRNITLELKPWAGVNVSEWISGDDHIHLTRDRADDSVYLSMLAAEDLTVGNFLQLQRQMDASVQYAHGKAGTTHRNGYVIKPGQESRNEFWGHINLLGASELIRPMSTGAMYANSAPSDPWPGLWFAQAKRLGALVGHAHFFPQPQHSTIYMDAALGNMDFVEVFQFGELRAEAWYELWNAGLRVTGVAGSDFPVPLSRRNPWPRWLPLLGPERTLVKAKPGETSFESWAAGVREGRVVVSNGPLVELNLDRSSGTARATAAFFQPLESLEIVRNGIVVGRTAGDGQRTQLTASVPLAPGDCCWLAARVRSRVEEQVVQAHTNPQWLGSDAPVEQTRAARQSLARKWEDQLARFRKAGIAFSTPERSREFYTSADRALDSLRK
jgi:hypothetical protein